MAGTRETQTRRSRSDLGEAPAQSPRERSQVYAHAVPNTAAGVQREQEDLKVLQSAFGNFFSGLSTAADLMKRSETEDRIQQIQIENKVQSAQGQADAQAGRSPDPALTNDFDYMSVFSRTKGINVGDKAALDFKSELIKQPMGTDPYAFRDSWFKDQLGDGTGDPIHDAAMYATFKQKTDEALLAFKVNNAKQQLTDGTDALKQEVFANADKANVEQLRDWFARGTQLSLGDEVKGRAQVLAALKAAATTPERLQKLVSLVHEKGYMNDGKSFADQFPLSAQQLSEEATARYTSALSAEAYEKYEGIQSKLRDPEVIGDEVKLASLAAQADDVRRRMGGESYHDQLVRSIDAQMDKVIKAKAAFNAFVVKGVQGGYPVDQEEINKQMPSLISKRLALVIGDGANPLSSPAAAEETARIVSVYHGIDGDTRRTMSAALGDGKNVSVQANAFRFYRALEAQGQDPAQYMDGDAYKAYTGIQSLVRTSAQGNVETALQLYNGEPGRKKDLGETPDWPILMGRPGDTREKVVTDVSSDLRAGLADSLGVTRFFGTMSAPGKIAMSPDIEKELLADYANTLRDYKSRGDSNAIETARKAVVKGMAQNYLTVPGQDGSVQIVRKRDYPAFAKLGKVGPGPAFNPFTGEMENTLDVFRRDMTRLKKIMPGHFGDAASSYVQRGKADVTENGGFMLMNGDEHMPVMFAPGQQIALNEPDSAFTKGLKGLLGLKSEDGKVITLPSDADAAAKDLQRLVGDNFEVVQRGDQGAPVFQLFYKFHTSTPEDIAALAAKYKRPRNPVATQKLMRNPWEHVMNPQEH